MFKLLRIGVIIIGLLGALIFFNGQIRAVDAIKENGEQVLFKLRPVDPRAVMLGDFMALRYSEDSLIDVGEATPANGTAIVKRDNNGVATFSRLSGPGEILAENEVKIKCARKIRNRASYGGERYYFQEGHAEKYEDAEYGVFRVSSEGRAVLIGLADENFKIILGRGKASP